MISDCSGFEELRQSLFWKDNDVIVMLQAYFDESGSHKGAKVMAFGGYISTTKKWRSFDRQWRAMLAAEGIQMMHWADLESRHGEFKGWSQERKVRVQKQAISIMKRNILCGFSAGVILKDYEEVIRDTPEKTFSSPYTFLIAATFHLVKLWITNNSIPKQMSYVFESGAGYDKEVYEMLTETKHIGWDFYRMKSVKSCVFTDKIDNSPLQSADIIAYETYKQILNSVVEEVRRDLRKSAESLLKAIPHNAHYFNKESLLKLVTHLEGEQRPW